MDGMSSEAQQPGPEAVTLNTIREWAEQTIETTAECAPGSRVAGYRHAARSVMAILDAHGRPPHEPVTYPEADR